MNVPERKFESMLILPFSFAALVSSAISSFRHTSRATRTKNWLPTFCLISQMMMRASRRPNRLTNKPLHQPNPSPRTQPSCADHIISSTSTSITDGLLSDIGACSRGVVTRLTFLFHVTRLLRGAAFFLLTSFGLMTLRVYK